MYTDSLDFPGDSVGKESAWMQQTPAMQETQVPSLGWENPLEEEITTRSSAPAWEIPWTEEPGGLQSMSNSTVQESYMT